MLQVSVFCPTFVLVKRIFQFGNLLLAAYLLALPLLIGLHQLHHESHIDHLHTQAETVLQASDCELCDFYQNQTAVIEVADVAEAAVFASPVQKITSQKVIRLLDACPSLRGPPMS